MPSLQIGRKRKCRPPAATLALTTARRLKLASRDYVRLKQLTGATTDAARRTALIRGLNPCPAAFIGRNALRGTDVVVRKHRASGARAQPEAMPRLRVNRCTVGSLRAARRQRARLPAAARWLIKNAAALDTILRVFWGDRRPAATSEHGEVAMHDGAAGKSPMCSACTALSPGTTQKCMATPRHLRAEVLGSHVATDTGGAPSTAIRALIKQLVAPRAAAPLRTRGLPRSSASKASSWRAGRSQNIVNRCRFRRSTSARACSV
jgi:hypothetical protein